VIFKAYAKKYPRTDKLDLSWEGHDPEYRKALKDGRRVLIKYTPAN